MTFDLYDGRMDEEYQAYLVRFIRSDNRSEWRATLQNVHKNEQHHFISEKELFLFLMSRLASLDSPTETNNRSLD
jgi:hypothetical protein